MLGADAVIARDSAGAVLVALLAVDITASLLSFALSVSLPLVSSSFVICGTGVVGSRVKPFSAINQKVVVLFRVAQKGWLCYIICAKL